MSPSLTGEAVRKQRVYLHSEMQRQHYCINFSHTRTPRHLRPYLRDPSAFIGAILAQVALGVLVIIAYLRNCVAQLAPRVWRPSKPGNPGFINPVRVCQPYPPEFNSDMSKETQKSGLVRAVG